MKPTVAKGTVIRLERTIPAPPHAVYRAWLEPGLLKQWLAPGGLVVTRAEIDERAGGRYRIWHADSSSDVGGFEAELLELVPDQKIVFRWGFAGPDRTNGPVFDSLLTVTLDETPDGTTALQLVHERLDELAEALPWIAASVQTGWELVLDKLTVLVEEER